MCNFITIGVIRSAEGQFQNHAFIRTYVHNIYPIRIYVYMSQGNFGVMFVGKGGHPLRDDDSPTQHRPWNEVDEAEEAVFYP